MNSTWNSWGHDYGTAAPTPLPTYSPYSPGIPEASMPSGPVYSPYPGPGAGGAYGPATSSAPGAGAGISTPTTPHYPMPTLPNVPGTAPAPTTPGTPYTPSPYTPETIGPHWSDQMAPPSVPGPVDPRHVAMMRRRRQMQRHPQEGGSDKPSVWMLLGGALVLAALGYGGWKLLGGRRRNPRKPPLGQAIVGRIKALPW